MFTDGLDPSALQWVREGLEQKERAVPSINVDTQSPRLVRENILAGRRKGKNAWGLPPTQLPNAHFHSGLLRPQISSAGVDDSSESIGSVSADNQDYEDSTDSEEHESGRYSLDSSPQSHFVGKVNHAELTGNGKTTSCGAADDYYYEYDRRLLSSRSNSKSNSRSNSRRESFGRLDCRQAQALQKGKDSLPYGCGTGDKDDQKCFYDKGQYSDGDSWVNSSKLNQESSAAEVEAVDRCNNAISRKIAGSAPYQWPISDHFGLHDLGSNKDAMNESDHFQEMGAPPSAPPMMKNDVSRVESNLSSTYPDSGRKSCSDELLQGNGVFEAAKHNNIFSTTESNKGECGLEQPFEARKRDHEGGPSTKQTNVSSQQPLAFTSGYAVWPTVIAYDACVRLCLRAWARGCVEAPEFLNDECVLLRSSFGLEHILLQPHDSVLQKPAMDNSEAIAASKRNKDAGKIRVQVRKVRMTMKVSSRCSFPSFDAARASLEFKSDLLAGWESVKKFCLNPRRISQGNSSRGATYMQAGAHYMRQVSGLLKAGVSSLRSTTMMDVSEETYSCLLRLKSTAEEDVLRVHPGSGDFHVFHPESANDDLILEVEDSKKNFQGRVYVQLSSISDDQNDRIRWWSLYDERYEECVGKVQLFINYAIDSGVSTFNKLGVVSETLAYDTVLEAAMQRQRFGKRNLRLHGSWKWLLSQFADYYGVSDAYTKLRYLSCIMEVATPTEDCFLLIHDLLYPVVSTRHQVGLNRQEKRMLCDVQDQVEQLLALAFENYKSLNEASPSGISEALTPVSGKTAPAVVPAVQLYTLLHDILSLEAQSTLRTYFQTAAMKRCRRHMAETDEFVSSNNEGFLIDPLTTSGAYSKMKSLCINLSKEVLTDIEIHNQHILPSSIDLPNIATGIYSVELCNRLRAFLVSCPPSSPSQPVIDLLLATADFERDLVSLNIRPLKGGVDAKDLFHLYIVLWIQDKRLNLLDFCKLDKVRWTGVTTQHGTSPFVEEMYERIRETLNEYDVLLSRWPEYTIALENAIADVEAAIVAALEKQYAEVLSPLKDVMVPKKFSFQYVQKLTRRRTVAVYSVPNQLGVFLNTIKRLLDILRPKIEIQMKSWVACLPTDGNERFGERLNEVAVILRTKYKNFLQAIVEKLIDNASMQRTTKLKKILQDTREAGGESEIRDRMQLLNSQLIDTIGHLHDVFSTRVFVAVCRGYWDRMGQDVLHFLETRKENRSWYKGSFYALSILDDLFASQMQKLQGHALQEKDLEPPRSIMEARSMLSRDAQMQSNDSNYLYF